MTRDEITPARLHETYSRTAAFYDGVVAEAQARTKLLAMEVLARRRGETFLEVGVGTGWCFGQVLDATGVEGAVGVDAAAGMIDVARAALRERGVATAPLLLGDATRLPVRDGCIDCLLCTYTLEVMATEDAVAALREVGRVLKPGGRAVLAGLTEGEGDDASFTDDWHRRYERDPEYFGGARPIRLTPLVAAAGLRMRERRYAGLKDGWPSEVVAIAREA